jgi:hypothetical protein
MEVSHLKYVFFTRVILLLVEGDFTTTTTTIIIIIIIIILVLGCNWPFLAVVKHVNK